MLQRFPLRAKLKLRGFTLIELIVVTSAVALLSAVVLDRVLLYQELAEKVSVQQAITAIRTSLHLQALNLIAKNRAEELPALAEQNPMDWLAEKPANYAGEFVSTRKNNVVSGRWYFSVDDKKLIYLVHNGKHFQPETEPKQIIYGVKILRGKSASGEDDVVEGVILEQLNSFSWFK